ncbi:MAG: response regulator transcription factor [Betaproteobacteria bacterium]|nr:response regulator transcription factor [Betaproteobacteria bacterium]
MIRILLADDHTIVREGIKHILAGTEDLSVTGEAGNAQETLGKLSRETYDLVLLDMSMPGVSGVDLIKQVKQRNARIAVLVLSMHKEDQFAVRALKAGAAGYLTKETAPDLLIAAIRRVAAGGRHISRRLAEKLACEMDPFTDRPLHELLSDREFEVFRLIVAGANINEIACQLSVSAKTVSTHKLRLMQKLKIDSNAGLVHYAIAERLFE